MNQPLVLIRPRCEHPETARRLSEVLAYALEGSAVSTIETAAALHPLKGKKILFAVMVGETGINLEYFAMLQWMREHPGCLEGSVGGVLVDGASELYTKSIGSELVFTANLAGCTFPGRPLVEGTGSLGNFTILARTMETDRFGAYLRSARELVERVCGFSQPRFERPKLLAVHASSHKTSNTLALWRRVREQIGDRCEISEFNLRNGEISDCSGCPYTMCLHFGEQGGCFYGGVMVDEVFPAIRQANALVMLCPNYNDALSANLTAFINRLTALFRQVRFYDKALFAIAVSGYSGNDIIAKQLICALNMNKTFYLPAHFSMLETANSAGDACKLPGIDQRIACFSQQLAAFCDQ